MKDKKNEVKEEFDELKYFRFVANIPFEDDKLLYDWNKNCQDRVPKGHNNYRWGKIIHDHLFVERFKERLDSIEEKLNSIIKKLEQKKEESENSDLFK